MPPSRFRCMFARLALLCGAGAATTTLLALVLLAREEGKSPLRPLNATSHVFAGPEAGGENEARPLLTGVGIATNIAASFFWASVTATLLAPHRSPSAVRSIATAAAVTGLAGLVDYAVVPKRLTPGWEHALRKRSVMIAMAAMGIGLAAGALAARSHDGRRT